MTDRAAEFREYLRTARRADLVAMLPELAPLVLKVGTEGWWTHPSVRAALAPLGLHMTRDIFYSPLHSPDEIARYYAALGDRPIEAARTVCDTELFSAEWHAVRAFLPELADIPRRSDDIGYCWDNDFFPNLDATAYYGYLRLRQPKRVVEVGSGFSTHIAARALRANNHGTLHVIEPNPTPTLRQAASDCTSFHESRVQDVPREFFEALEPGDALFIDGSHCCKTGSDVNHLLFNVIPLLDPGVQIHFHDIFLPYEYPTAWTIGRGWAWNEQYLVLAWLMSNASRKAVLGTHALLRERADDLARDFAAMDVGSLSGGSFWVR
jgi:hypothetical protein